MTKIFVLHLCLLIVAFGFVNGSYEKEKIGIFELEKGGLSLKVTNWGASIVSLVLPDKNGMTNFFLLKLIFLKCCFIYAMFLNLVGFLFNLCLGKLGDIVLGYDSIKEYTVSNLSFLVQRLT